MPPSAQAAGEPLTGLDLGCAAGYGMVNVRPSSGSDPTTNLIGLTINSGSARSITANCSPSSPGPTPAVPGNNNALLGGNARFYRSTGNDTVPGNPQNPRFYINSSTNTSGGLDNTIQVSDAWANQASTDALAVSSYISSFTANGGCSGVTLTSCDATSTSFANNSIQNLLGIGGLNFYTITNFGRNVTLNFTGNPNDFFVFDVPDSSIVTNKVWNITGLDPSQIIFNITGRRNRVTLNSGAIALGTLLVNSNDRAACAGNGNRCNGGTVSMANDTELYGSLIVINNNDTSPIAFGTGTTNGPVINGKPFNPSRLRRVPVPGPLPVLGGVAAFSWSRRLRRRLKASPHSVPA